MKRNIERNIGTVLAVVGGLAILASVAFVLTVENLLYTRVLDSVAVVTLVGFCLLLASFSMLTGE